MTIRDGLASDLDSLAELLLVVHQLHVEAQPERYRAISRAEAAAFLAARLVDGNAYLRVAEVDGDVVGYCAAERRSSPGLPLLHSRELLYVNEIVVREDDRRRGLGRALLADLKELARRDGIEEIELDVSYFNGGARDFFERQGFGILRQRVAMRVDRS